MGSKAAAGSGSEAVGSMLRTQLRAGLKAALARWVFRKRAEHHRSPVDARDEATHPWDGRRRFGEDYTFVAAQAGLGLVVRLEWLPGRASHRVWVTLLRPDGVFSLEQGQRVVPGTERDPWRASGLELDCLEPLRSWSVRYVGRLSPAGPLEGDAQVRASLDLTFCADAEPFSPGADDDPELLARRFGAATWDANLLRSVRRDQNRGYAQSGRLEGTVALGDELIPVRAPSLRQHTWGVRDWGAPDEAFQCFVAWPDGKRAWVHHTRFPFVTLEGGFIRRPEGTLEPISSLGASLERRPDRAPARASVQIGARTELSEVSLEMLADTELTVDGRGAVQLGLFRIPGEGYGIWGGQRRILPRVFTRPGVGRASNERR